jgi:hypothetical protein
MLYSHLLRSVLRWSVEVAMNEVPRRLEEKEMIEATVADVLADARSWVVFA